jgi:hypothetical protein
VGTNGTNGNGKPALLISQVNNKEVEETKIIRKLDIKVNITTQTTRIPEMPITQTNADFVTNKAIRWKNISQISGTVKPESKQSKIH